LAGTAARTSAPASARRGPTGAGACRPAALRPLGRERGARQPPARPTPGLAPSEERAPPTGPPVAAPRSQLLSAGTTLMALIDPDCRVRFFCVRFAVQPRDRDPAAGSSRPEPQVSDARGAMGEGGHEPVQGEIQATESCTRDRSSEREAARMRRSCGSRPRRTRVARGRGLRPGGRAMPVCHDRSAPACAPRGRSGRGERPRG